MKTEKKLVDLLENKRLLSPYVVTATRIHRNGNVYNDEILYRPAFADTMPDLFNIFEYAVSRTEKSGDYVSIKWKCGVVDFTATISRIFEHVNEAGYVSISITAFSTRGNEVFSHDVIGCGFESVSTITSIIKEMGARTACNSREIKKRILLNNARVRRELERRRTA